MCSRGVIVVNAYVFYNTECELNSVSPMSHYEFHRHLVIRKPDPEMFWDRINLQVQNYAKGLISQ